MWKNCRGVSTVSCSKFIILIAYTVRYPRTESAYPKPQTMAILKDYVHFSPASPSQQALPNSAALRGFALYDYRKDGTKVLLVNCYGSPFVLWPEPRLLDAYLRNESPLEEVVRKSRATTLTMRGLSFMQRLRMAYWMRKLGAALREVRALASA